MSLLIPVSAGELLDKLTILLIKKERIADKAKLENIILELSQLQTVFQQRITQSAELDTLISELRLVNETLWDIEDEIRGCERDGNFGTIFIKLARSVYRTNDRRAELKYQINGLLGSELVEEKSYEAY
jgi:chaperonin cofactor prefoldin